jgi:hypothetical protein
VQTGSERDTGGAIPAARGARPVALQDDPNRRGYIGHRLPGRIAAPYRSLAFSNSDHKIDTSAGRHATREESLRGLLECVGKKTRLPARASREIPALLFREVSRIFDRPFRPCKDGDCEKGKGDYDSKSAAHTQLIVSRSQRVKKLGQDASIRP